MSESHPFVVRTASADETEALGRTLGALLAPGDVVALSGELGAGKTVLVRGIVAGSGSRARVTSPTFTFIREYAGPVRFFHADLYRLDTTAQLVDLGFEELFDREGIVVIEWAERAGTLLPGGHLWITVTFGPEEDERDLRLTPQGPRGEEILSRLAGRWAGRR